MSYFYTYLGWTPIYKNVRYEVVHVIKHTPRVKQMHLTDTPSNG